MKEIERANLIKISGAFIISLAAFIAGFFLRGNNDFTIPIVMLIGALLLYITGKIVRHFYNKYKNKSNIFVLMGIFGVSIIFVSIISLIVYIFHLVSINITIKRSMIFLLIGFILIGISYFSLKTRKMIKPIIIMIIILSMIIPMISIKVSSTDFGETYLSWYGSYETNPSNAQFQYKAKAALSPQCSPVKGKIAPSKAQKRQQLERNITPQIINQKMISDIQFQNKLTKNIKLKNITDYASKIGYIPFENGTQEVTYDNGLKAIIAPMQLKNKSLDNKAVYIASFSQNDSSNFSFVAQIQNENGTPTITMFNEEGGVVIDLINGAIIREWGHHSCSYWQCIGHCAYYWIFIGNLGYFCKAACTACYGLPGPWTCGPCIACLIVFAADCGVNCYSDNCYWYPCQKDCSDENYCESFVYYCDGDDRRKHRLCHDLECNTEIPGQSGSCVDETGSPSWQDDAFVETCTYGCNEATGNCQGAVTCYGDGDCGDTGWIGSPSCSGGDVYQTWREYTCYNAGTESSYCDYDDDYILKEECTSGECSGGECVASESCEDPDYPWLCNEGCWGCVLGNEDRSICCPDSGDPDWCCMDVGPYCNTNNGECDICGGYYPYECDTSTYDCWHCDSGELCCAEEYGDRDPENMWCCYTQIGAVCMANGSCCLPYNETCNNLDDDCDGTIDSFSEGCGVGACANGTKTCTAGSWGSCSTDGLSTSETCNNVDDDCDGSVDESLSQECGTDVGACVKGTQTCSAGNWSACGGSYVGPTDEICNSIDDNCNNITDEQNICNNTIVINLEFPENNTVEYINSTPTFGFNVTNVNYTSFNCTLWLDNGTPTTYSDDSIWISVGTSWNLTANRTITDNVYYWWIACTDGVNSNISEKRIITINVVDDLPIVSLISPLNNNISTTGNVTFNCSATDDFDLDNITLYHNISGTWLANETKILTGTSDYETFTIDNIIDETSFIWNCLTYDNASQYDWGDTNYTVDINITTSNITITSLTELYSNNNRRIFQFIIENNGDISLTNINWTIDFGDNNTAESYYPFNLTSTEDILVYVEHEYTDDNESFTVTANTHAGNLSASESITVGETPLEITSFTELYSMGREKIWQFVILNNGESNLTNIYWNISGIDNPISSVYPINLTVNESILVYVQDNLTHYQEYTITAKAFTDTLSDTETLTTRGKELEVHNINTLYTNGLTKIFEFFITNTYTSAINNLNWSFDTGEEIINSIYPFNLTASEDMQVMIENQYSSSGNYSINASVQNSDYYDSENKTITF